MHDLLQKVWIHRFAQTKSISGDTNRSKYIQTSCRRLSISYRMAPGRTVQRFLNETVPVRAIAFMTGIYEHFSVNAEFMQRVSI